MNKEQIDLFHKLDVKFNKLSLREHLIVEEAAKKLQEQIQIDAEYIRALQKQNGELTDKVRELEEKLEQTGKDLADYQFNYPTIKELEAQIEKMKCCAKCSHCNTYITTCIPHKHFVRLEEVCEDFELRR